ncbi:MAG: RidA family protein [Alphaproteobacteria bacterium]|jgi:enamine deaminase RidA (YjgF/YER057c/UK114 family)|nr:RidA family protein [Alphaproteobacteria bacterium]
MTGRIDARLTELNISLPAASAPAANYVPVVIAGNLAFVSGQVPVLQGEFKYLGKVGVELNVEQGQQAARLCALNVIAQLKLALGGDLDRVRRCVKVGGFVNCESGFGEQPKVINGASDLFVQVFGDAGRHARFAVGTNALPFNVAVEVDAVFEVA